MSSPLDRIAWRAERRRSMRPVRDGRSRRVRFSATLHGACSSNRRTCSVSVHVISSKSLWRRSSSALYPLELAGNSVASCSRFICDALRPRAFAHAFARSGDRGSARLRPGRTPAADRGSGGAQKMSKAASKVGMSSLRLTKTERSALRKSSSCFRSMQPNARVASVRRRGPASNPASWSSRAKAPRRGRRSTRDPSCTLRLLDQGWHLLAHPLQVLLVLQRRAHGRADEVWVDPRRAQRGERPRPVEGLRHPRHLVEVHPAQALDEGRDLAGQAVRRLGRARADDLDLLVEVGVVDPVVEAAALQRVVHLARTVGCDHDERHLAGLDGPDLRDGNLEVGEQLEQESLELLVGAGDGVEQRAAEQKLRAEDLALGGAAVLAFAHQPDVEKLAGIVPLVDGMRQVDALVALEADQPRAKDLGHDLGRLRLANPGLAFYEERLLQLEGEKDGRRERAVADVLALAQASLDVLDGWGRAHGGQSVRGGLT